MGDCLLRRRKKDTIPYTTVDYILFDNTANSTLNTGIVQSLDNKVILTFDALGYKNCGIYELYGAPDSNQKNKLITTSTTDRYSGSDGTAYKNFNGSFTGKHTYEWNVSGEVRFDGSTVIESPLKHSAAAAKPIIVGRSHSNTGSQYYCKAKIYRFRIENATTGTAVMDLIPVQYDDGGTIKYGFYDKVSKTLKTATGWIGGNDT